MLAPRSELSALPFSSRRVKHSGLQPTTAREGHRESGQSVSLFLRLHLFPRFLRKQR